MYIPDKKAAVAFVYKRKMLTDPHFARPLLYIYIIYLHLTFTKIAEPKSLISLIVKLVVSAHHKT
jgi:hypothetical protein